MNRNTKILIGLGAAAAIAYYLYAYTKVADIVKLKIYKNPCKGENEVPCNNGSGKCYMIDARYITDPCQIDKPQTTPPMGDVDENYNKCLKEFQSLPPLPVQPNFDFKGYKEDYINSCMKRSQQSSQNIASTGITGLKF
jgi:hypothetical protein